MSTFMDDETAENDICFLSFTSPLRLDLREHSAAASVLLVDALVCRFNVIVNMLRTAAAVADVDAADEDEHDDEPPVVRATEAAAAAKRWFNGGVFKSTIWWRVFSWFVDDVGSFSIRRNELKPVLMRDFELDRGFT